MSYRGIFCVTKELLSCSASTVRPGPVTGSLSATGYSVSVLRIAISGSRYSSNFFAKWSHNTEVGGWKSRLKDCLQCVDRKATEFKVKLSQQKNFIRNSTSSVPVMSRNLSAFSKRAYMEINSSLDFLTVLFAKQCNQILAMRIKRSTQIVNFYSKLGYDKQAVKNVIQKLGWSFAQRVQRSFKKTESLAFLFSTAALFNWDDKKIKEQELTETADEISLIQHSKVESQQMNIDEDSKMMHQWEKVINRDNLAVYRKLLPDSTYLYEYKVFGTFNDIPARAFFNAQMDLEHRKQWDKLVIKLDVIDRDDKSGTEVVQWITHFPYPMYHREYIYLRRSVIDVQQRLMVIVSRHTDHPTCPVTDQVVRVDTYMSKMVIKPHSTSFDEDGFDYILTYYDNPKANIPTLAYKWMASTGVPDFVEKIHTAAKTLNEKRKGVRSHEDGDYKTSSPGGVPM